MASMTEPDEDWFDPDIATMKLGYGEKAGLQIYRNHTRSFEERAIEKFVEALDLEPLDLTDFSVSLISSLKRMRCSSRSSCARLLTIFSAVWNSGRKREHA